MTEILEEFRDLPMDEFVRVGDVVTCLSEIHYEDDLRMHVTGLVNWAIGKRCEPLDVWVKLKEPRLLTLKEVKYDSEEVVWLEVKGMWIRAASFTRLSSDMMAFEMMGHDGEIPMFDCGYGSHWRCWNKVPSYDQRMNTPWEDAK